MEELKKRELIKLIEQYGELKGELGEYKALLTRDLETEFKKDNVLSEIINIIKNI